VDVKSVIASLAAIVRVHEGNRTPAMSALLDEAEQAIAAVDGLIDAADAHLDSLDNYEGNPVPINKNGGTAKFLRTALVRCGGTP
jgi:hypothetical protein